MLDWTDRHCRYFLRLVSRNVRLYTEMITTSALLHGDRDSLLAFDAAEHPLAVQLGGSVPVELARCASIAEQAGFDEVNLNVGCPSDRVQSGRFGACLMLEPDLVADAVCAMREAVSIPVTVKTRIGVDFRDSYDELADFVVRLVNARVNALIVHARKAWLKGLSPKQNRDIPPLHYEHVHRLKKDFPALQIHINGGIKTLEEVALHLQHVDGVMIGREVYHNPWLLADVDQVFFASQAPPTTRRQVVEKYMRYAETELASGTRLHQMTRHILGLFHGQPGARAWRRHLSEHACRPGADIRVIEDALSKTNG